MPLWLIFLLLGLIKLPIAALMLWIPLRSDEAMSAKDDDGRSSAEDDGGGSKVLPAGPRNPHPRPPLSGGRRRGAHGTPPPGSPKRVRHAHARVRVTRSS